MLRRYYLSLGSNLEPESNLPAALAMLGAYGKVAAVSSVYESPPVGASGPQPNYLNAAAIVESSLDPLQFQTNAIAAIEADLGRVRAGDKFAARTIDIDIMLIDDQVLSIENRAIPSPEILERDFVAVLLAEIAPDLIHPLTGERLKDIASRFLVTPDHLRLRDSGETILEKVRRLRAEHDD